MFNREYTKEEKLYRRLLFAYLHYNGRESDAFKQCEELLAEVRSGELAEDFKRHFESLWKDQVSKLYETHKNYYEGLKMKFDRASGSMA